MNPESLAVHLDGDALQLKLRVWLFGAWDVG